MSDGPVSDGPVSDGPVSDGRRLEVVVPALLDGMRADRAVAMVAGISRAVAASLVDAGRVDQDGSPIPSRSVPLRGGARLGVDLPGADAGPDPDPDVPFTVVYEDDLVVVVDKPAGVVVHPGAGRTAGTLVSGLLARYPDLAAGGDTQRPGIVHRLDRGTSGLLAVARTSEAHRSLAAQLKDRTMGRRYLVLVAGHLAEDRGVVDAPIGRSVRRPTLMTVSAQGRPARTRYTVLRRYDEPFPSTFAAVKLETGRTHQIRVHLAAIGHPVVGDDRYGPAGRRGGTLLAPGRLFLHAAELGFDHPGTGERVVTTAPLPTDLASAIGDPPALPPPESS